MSLSITDKYSSVYGLGGQTYVYHHEEDESSFQLVDTARVQKPQHQKTRARYNQVGEWEWEFVIMGMGHSREMGLEL